MSRRFILPAVAIVCAFKAVTGQQVRQAELSGFSRIVSASTQSNALDRIDQTHTTLDGMFIREGTGRGATVYVFDSGVSAHPQLRGRVRMGYNPNNYPVCKDHGTGVATAIAGSSLGVATEALIVDVRTFWCDTVRINGVLRDTVKGTEDEIVAAARWVVWDHQRHGGPSVANLSLYVDSVGRSAKMDRTMKSLVDAGITVVSSAGNKPIDACKVTPANYPEVISVGASMISRIDGVDTDRKAESSAWGKCVSLYAPGFGLVGVFGQDGVPTQNVWGGTSISTAYVSGADAIYLETHSDASPAEVKKTLRERATLVSFGKTTQDTVRMLYVGLEKTPTK